MGVFLLAEHSLSISLGVHSFEPGTVTAFRIDLLFHIVCVIYTFSLFFSTESVLLFFLFSVYQYFLPPYSSRTFLNVSISIVSVTVSLCICSEDLRAPINPPPPRSKSQPNLRHTTQPPHLPLKVSTRSLDRFLSTSPLFAFLPVFAFCFNFSDHLQRQLPLPCLHWIFPLISPPSSPLS